MEIEYVHVSAAEPFPFYRFALLFLARARVLYSLDVRAALSVPSFLRSFASSCSVFHSVLSFSQREFFLHFSRTGFFWMRLSSSFSHYLVGFSAASFNAACTMLYLERLCNVII